MTAGAPLLMPVLVLTLVTCCFKQAYALLAAMCPEAGQCPSWYIVGWCNATAVRHADTLMLSD